jgi:hypothetical protein
LSETLTQPLLDQLADAARSEEERRRIVDDVHPEGRTQGSGTEGDWLPAPNWPIYLVMRLYCPKEAALNGTWLPPAVQRTK